MSAETDLYTALSSNAALTALVQNKIDNGIYNGLAPEGRDIPYVLFQRADTAPWPTIGGKSVGEQVTLQIQCWAKHSQAADDIGRAAVTAIEAAQFMVFSRRAAYDADLNEHLFEISCNYNVCF